MMTLIGSPKTRAFRVLWMLEELDVEYELIDAQPRSAEALAVNPSGKVPALRVDEGVITDSVAICQYLADRYQRLTAPAGTYERAVQDGYTQFAVDDMDGILWTKAKHVFVVPEDMRVEVGPACRWDFGRAMDAFAKRLGGKKYVMGDEFTVPDLVIGHCAGWAQQAGMEWPAGAVTDYFERVRSRPAFQKAVAVRDA
ncbi:MAG: glutathione S-transferase family protein [Gammaproteobacteria bacterium]|nr:glutathione S-transferase family protein [Gammaproteobacteria bacterium]